MDVFRVDFLTFKEVQVGKIDNIDTIFKKVANDSFSKVREVESEIGLSKSLLLSSYYSEGRIHEVDQREYQGNSCSI